VIKAMERALQAAEDAAELGDPDYSTEEHARA
jgi:hypothetical protein